LFLIISGSVTPVVFSDFALRRSTNQFSLFQVGPKVENDLNRGIGKSVLVETIDVCFQLLAVTENLMPTLLESALHVVWRCSPNIVPQDVLFFSIRVCSGMFCTDVTALCVRYPFVT